VHPRLFEEANLDFRGTSRPGLTITAEIVRRDVRCAVKFEIIRKGKIKFIHEQIPNMATWAEIRAHFASIDERIPSLSYYGDEENRPHMNNALLAFRLVEGIEVPDTSGGFGGTAGGVNRGGYVLPPIIFPAKPIDVTDRKIAGGKKGVVDKDSDSSSDSQEDEEN
jgi:hypothetical protein